MRKMSEKEMQELMDKHDQNSGVFARQIAEAQHCWDAGIKIVKGCGHLIIPSYHVVFEPMADQKIKILQKSYPRLEWLAYLVGKVDHAEHRVTVEDLVIPRQTVSAAQVNSVEYSWDEGLPIIGVIHSHHTMGAFFSGTDDAYINQNHDVSIVVSTNPNSPIKGQVRMKIPCGSYVLAEDVTFSVGNPVVVDEKAFRADFGAKIGTFTYPNPVTTIVRNAFQRGVGGSFARGGGRVLTTPPQHIPSANNLGGTGVGSGYDATARKAPVKAVANDTVRAKLLEYYNEDDVEEIMADGSAEEELMIIKDIEDAQKALSGESSVVIQDDSAVWVDEGDVDESDTELVEAEVVESEGDSVWENLEGNSESVVDAVYVEDEEDEEPVKVALH